MMVEWRRAEVELKWSRSEEMNDGGSEKWT